MLYSGFKYLGRFCLLGAFALCLGGVGVTSFAAPPAASPGDKESIAKPDPNEDTPGPEEEDEAETPAPAPVSAAPAKSAAGASQTFGDYLSGRFAESQGDTNNGTKYLEDSLKRDPNNKEVLAGLYRMLILSGKIEDALPLAHKLAGVAVVEEGSEFTPEMLTAIDEIKHANYAAAEKQLKLVHKTGINSLLLPLLEQWLKLGQGQIKTPLEAKDIMPEARMILPHVYLNAAFINDIAGFDDAAERQYEAAVKDPRIEPFRAVEALANFYARKGMKEKRAHFVDEYLSAHGETFLASELLTGQPDDAHPERLVKDTKEGAAEVFYTLANIFHGVRPPADEVATLHLALYLKPDYPSAQFLLAGAYELGADYASAIAAYKSINPASAYFMRGRIRAILDESEMGNKTEAIAKLDQIASELPHDIEALLAKGDLQRSQNRFKEAIATYDQALTRVKTPQRRHWIIYFSRGACYERIGQWDKAEADLKKALVLQPGEPDVLNYIGYSWLTMGHNIAEAKKMIEQAYDARPEDAHIIDSMGYSLYVSGDFASAQEYFEQALERTPNDPTVNDHLGDTYWQQGRKIEARYQWERALADDPDEETARDLHKKLSKGLAMVHPLQAVEGKKPASAPAATQE